MIRRLIKEEGVDLIGLVKSKHNVITRYDMMNGWKYHKERRFRGKDPLVE